MNAVLNLKGPEFFQKLAKKRIKERIDALLGQAIRLNPNGTDIADSEKVRIVAYFREMGIPVTSVEYDFFSHRLNFSPNVLDADAEDVVRRTDPYPPLDFNIRGFQN